MQMHLKWLLEARVLFDPGQRLFSRTGFRKCVAERQYRGVGWESGNGGYVPYTLSDPLALRLGDRNETHAAVVEQAKH
jgi:hypothetical protein